MEATTFASLGEAEGRARLLQRRDEELAALSAHLSALTARWLELAGQLCEDGEVDDPGRYLAFRCGITVREARESLRVAEELRELPVIRAAFERGELTYAKVRALTRVATAESEESLLELAGVLTASQLERALRAFQRIATEDARRTHELEYVSYHFDEDGSLFLRARLPAEDGTLLVKALEAARERVYERRRRAERANAASREQQAAAGSAGSGRGELRAGQPGGAEDTAAQPDAAASGAATGPAVAAEGAAAAGRAGGTECAAAGAPVVAAEPARSARVEALLELAEASLAAPDGDRVERARVVVHVDAAALSSARGGRCELQHGPVVSPETARRLGCDAELVAQVERDGLPISVGRRRRTVPPALRRLLETRHDHTCCFPGCERRRHLQAHHRRHWAHGGQTSLDNLVLLCFHHHRLVHEGGYRIEDDPAGGLRFRNRHGVACRTRPSRPPPASADQALAANQQAGHAIGPRTNRNGDGNPLDLDLAVAAISHALESRHQPDEPVPRE